jgi:uncharacterized protein (DUF58 family)
LNELFRQFLQAGERAGARYALAAPRQSALGMAGLQLGARAGSSLEFREHRDYQPGDDLRRIDWNAYARSDRLTLKLYREEINPHCDLVLDASRSMALEGSAKAEAALGLTALLAVAAANAGFTQQVWLAGERCQPLRNGTARPTAWELPEFGYTGNPAESLTRTPPRWRRQGLRLLLSDLLWPGEPAQVLQPLAREAAHVIIIQLLAAQDAEPPLRGRLRLIDVESGEPREIFVDDAALARYRAALTRHQQLWRQACRQGGATLVELIAEEIVTDWQLAPLVGAGVLTV